MSITVHTSKPGQLLQSIKEAIDDGEVATWEYDKDGDFTHKPAQWRKKAWLKPEITTATLEFNLIGQKSAEMTKEVYGVYHGRFIEMLLAHFDDSFSAIVAIPG